MPHRRTLAPKPQVKTNNNDCSNKGNKKKTTDNQNKEMKHVFELLKAEIWRYEKSIQVLSALVKATDDEGLLESLLRDEEYHHQFKRAYEILLNSEPNDAVSDTAQDDSSTGDGQQ